jgi:hypothetical protein
MIVGAAETLDELWPSGHLREKPVEAVQAETDPQPGITPAQLFSDEEAHACILEHRQFARPDVKHAEIQVPVLLEHVPEDGVGLDHVGRLGQPVERHSSRPHDFLGEAVCGIAHRALLLGERGFEIY